MEKEASIGPHRPRRKERPRITIRPEKERKEKESFITSAPASIIPQKKTIRRMDPGGRGRWED
jgi:hypothetical protein